MAPEGTGLLAGPDMALLRRVDACARERLWGSRVRRRAVSAWLGSRADADVVLAQLDSAPAAALEQGGFSPERVASAVAAVVEAVLASGPEPLVDDPDDDIPARLPLTERPPSQLKDTELTGVIVRRLMNGRREDA